MFATSIKRQIISGEDDFGRVRKVLWSSSLVTWDTIGRFRQIYYMISSAARTRSHGATFRRGRRMKFQTILFQMAPNSALFSNDDDKNLRSFHRRPQ